MKRERETVEFRLCDRPRAKCVFSSSFFFQFFARQNHLVVFASDAVGPMFTEQVVDLGCDADVRSVGRVSTEGPEGSLTSTINNMAWPGVQRVATDLLLFSCCEQIDSHPPKTLTFAQIG